MILYPSIHLKDGQVARLTRTGGDFHEAEILHHDPAHRAREFENQKFQWLHVVDLNGAFEGAPVNKDAVDAILKLVSIPVQLSGGIRDLATIEKWLEKGISRIVLTSAAVQNPDLVKDACRRFPGRIAVKIDSHNGYVTTVGWTRRSTIKALDMALRAEEAGASAIIFAVINSDGALSEVNIEAMIDLAYTLSTPIIASGGVQSLQELIELKKYSHVGIEGLILGRALYNGRITASEALAIAEKPYDKDAVS